MNDILKGRNFALNICTISSRFLVRLHNGTLFLTLDFSCPFTFRPFVSPYPTHPLIPFP